MSGDFVSVTAITEDCDKGVGGAPADTDSLIPAYASTTITVPAHVSHQVRYH